MRKAQRLPVAEQKVEAYEQPVLTVHGTVQDLTSGGSGPDPDGSPQGSAFPDGQQP